MRPARWFGHGAGMDRGSQYLDTVYEAGSGPREVGGRVDTEEGVDIQRVPKSAQSGEELGAFCDGRIEVVTAGHEDNDLGRGGVDLIPGESPRRRTDFA